MTDQLTPGGPGRVISRMDVMKDAIKIRLSGYDPVTLQIMAAAIHDALKEKGERVIDWSESRPAKDMPGVYNVHLTARHKDN